MIPSWIINTLVILLGCIFAVYLGSTLPEYGPLGLYLVGVSIVCALCIAFNNLPLLLALAAYIPFAPPIPFFSHFPTVALALGWCALVIFFRVCMTKKIEFVPSCNVLILVTFCWVPIRFLLNPVQKFGNSVAGGSGGSGANAYFLYAFAGILVIFLGAILTSRQKLDKFLFWMLIINLLVGGGLLVCAFIPSTQSTLAAWGMFAAGNLTDNIARFVELPGYGLNILLMALCPAAFRMRRWQSAVCIVLALVMMIVGGNRSAVAAAFIAVPVILILRRRVQALLIFVAIAILGIAILRLTVDQMDSSQIPALIRSLGVFDSKIDKSTGGDASAEWRYKVWASGIEKIKEAPLIGKGYGNLPHRYDLNAMTEKRSSDDFEEILAIGLAHNGFISAAYGFGIPFAFLLSFGILWRNLSHIKSALLTNKNDPALLDFHAWLAGSLSCIGILVYSAADLNSFGFWFTVGMGIILDHVSGRSGVGSPTPPPDLQEIQSRQTAMGTLYPAPASTRY